MIKAIFFDVDGTLVSFNTHQIPNDVKDVIKALRANGIKVFIATGRMLNMLDDILDGMEFDGYISYNGAFCTDGSREKVIYKNTIPKEELERLKNYLSTDTFPVSFMCRNEMFVNYLDSKVSHVAKVVNVKPPIEKPLDEVFCEDVFQMCVYTSDDKLNYLMDNILSLCEYSRWTDVFADVNVKGLSKKVGIDKMLEYYNIPLEQTMAFGDGGNDIEMLKHVGIGVAMGNAAEHVKAVADHVTDHVDNGGIIKAIKYFSIPTSCSL